MNSIQGPLTPAETEVLLDIACGLNTEQMAAKQFRSQETVRSHAKNILRKLGAVNRAHAVAIAYHIGLLRAPTAEVRRCERCSASLPESTSQTDRTDPDTP